MVRYASPSTTLVSLVLVLRTTPITWGQARRMRSASAASRGRDAPFTARQTSVRPAWLVRT